MKKIFSTFLLLGVVLLLRAQIQEPVKFTTELKQTSDTEVQVIFSATIDAGWHVYSTELGDGPTSASFNTTVLKGAALKGKLRPEGKEHKAFDEMFGMQVRYIEL